MYSVHPDTGKVVTHRLPWERGSPNLDLYVRKGFTYERPAELALVGSCPHGPSGEAIMPAKNLGLKRVRPKRKYRKKVKHAHI